MSRLSGHDKGVPGLDPVNAGDLADKQWNILAEDMTFPVAVLREQRLHHNLKWMQTFISDQGIQLYPHGKTTMSPELFALQMEYGCAGLTAATVQHMAVYCAAGVPRVIMANQLLGRANLDKLMQLLKAYPELELLQIIDSEAAADALLEAHARHGKPGNIGLLIEMGASGGRTGVRTPVQGVALARHIAGRLPVLGVEAFEGLFYSDEPLARVERHLDDTVALYKALLDEDLMTGTSGYLSAGGSAFYDVVVNKFKATNAEILLRSGCYISHDHGMYERAFEAIGQRKLITCRDSLLPALEVWSVVQSIPEPGLGFAALGKRDVSFDVEMPLVRYRYRAGMAEPQPLDGEIRVTALNDQHAYLSFSDDIDLSVGDLLGFGVSHPCTTFDKWQQLFLVDESYAVQGCVHTCF